MERVCSTILRVKCSSEGKLLCCFYFIYVLSGRFVFSVICHIIVLIFLQNRDCPAENVFIDNMVACFEVKPPRSSHFALAFLPYPSTTCVALQETPVNTARTVCCTVETSYHTKAKHWNLWGRNQVIVAIKSVPLVLFGSQNLPSSR